MKRLALWLPVGLGGLVVIAILGWLIFGNHSKKVINNSSPVPAAIKSVVSFPIYFPDQSKLPSGYKLDTSSFSSGSGAVEFIVTNGSSKLVFTEQSKPSSQDLQTFVANRLPLHNTIDTNVGTATVGAIGNNSFVSLPTNGSTWILVSGPYSINQDALKSILNSLSK